MLSDVDIEAVVSRKDAGLLSGAPVVGGNIVLTCLHADGRSRELALTLDGRCIPGEVHAGCFVFLLVGLSFLQGLDMEISADSCCNLFALCLAPEDCRIFAALDLECTLCRDFCRCIGGACLFSGVFRIACADIDTGKALRGKGSPDACGGGFVLHSGDACILSGFQAHVSLRLEGDVFAGHGRAFVSICGGKACRSAGCDSRPCILSARRICVGIGLGGSQSQVQGEVVFLLQGILSAAEVLVDEAACLPCVDGL